MVYLSKKYREENNNNVYKLNLEKQKTLQIFGDKNQKFTALFIGNVSKHVSKRTREKSINYKLKFEIKMQ